MTAPFHLQCRECGALVAWPEATSPKQKHAMAAMTRIDTLDGARFAEILGLGAREAKALALHVTKVSGSCHRCGQVVPAGESICACGAANLDW